MQNIKRIAVGGISYFVVLLLAFNVVAAQQSSSSNYSVNEINIGAGGINEAFGSTNYSARATIGELSVGNLVGSSFQAFAGFETTDEPFLEFIVPSTYIDLGVLSAGSTATTTATFSVRTFLASGYVVQTYGLPTSESGNTIAPITTAAASSAGTEQFGINLVANTSPASFGAVASGGSGTASSGYNTANNYQYNEGDTIAESSESSVTTTFTISYIYNIQSVTEAGLYQLSHDLVATSTF